MFKKYQLSICLLFLTGLLLSPISVVSAEEDVVAPLSETEQIVDNTNNSSEVAVDEDVVLPSSESESTDEETIEVTEVTAEEGSSQSDKGTGDEDSVSDPARVFGTDDRVRIDNTSNSPYRQTVQIYARFGNEYQGGSGVLIAPNKVLTATHVLRHKETGRWAEVAIVIPGKITSSEPYGRRKGSTYHLLTAYYNDSSLTYTTVQMKEDIAIITLDTPFPPAVGHLPVSTDMFANQKIQVIGYPASKLAEDVGKHGYMYAASGPILEVQDKVIRYQVDMTPGHSGGPVLDTSNNVIAINVAENPHQNTARRIDGQAIELIERSNKNLSTNERITKFVGVHKLYHAKKNYYFYTIHKSEVDHLVKAGNTKV